MADQDGLLPGDRALIVNFLGPLLAGQDPFGRQEIWRSSGRQSYPSRCAA